MRNPWLYFLSLHQQPGHLPDASTFPSCSLHAVLAVSEVGGGAASRTSSSLGLAFFVERSQLPSTTDDLGFSQIVRVARNLPANAGDIRHPVLIPGLGRSPGGGHGYPLHYACWRILWTEEPDWLHPWGHKESNTTELTKHSHTQADDRGRYMWEGCRERWRLQVK